MDEVSKDPWAARLEAEQAWRAGLKVGDEVAFWDGWNHHFMKVTSASATRVTVNGHQFKRDGGRSYGGSTWDRSSIEPVSQEIRDKLRRTALLSQVGNIKWEKLETPVIEAVLALVHPVSARPEHDDGK